MLDLNLLPSHVNGRQAEHRSSPFAPHLRSLLQPVLISYLLQKASESARVNSDQC